MRKALVKIFAVAVAVLCNCACSDFLNERETTTYDGAALVNTTASLESAMLGIHRQFALSGFKTGAFCEWLAPASGISHWGNTNALINPMKRWSCCLNFTRYANHPEAYDSFKSFYRTIYLCNHFLETMDKYASEVEGKFKEEKDRDYYIRCREEIRGEVLFVRAMSYFYLVRLYGDVSLYLDAPDTSDQIEYKARENFWTVYCQILDDLTAAVSKMRSFKRMCSVSASVAGGTTGNASGRVCNHAAVACRSLVYLTIGTLLDNPEDNFWTADRTPAMLEAFSSKGIGSAADAFRLALADARKVIPVEDGGETDQDLGVTPFRLEDVYSDLFRWEEADDWQSLERIWALPRSPETNDAGSALTMWALPNYYNGTAKTENFGRCRPDRWFFQKWCGTHGPEKGTGTDNENIYVDCGDPRMKANLAYNSFVGKDKIPMNCYPQDSRVFPGDDNMMKYYGLPFYKKYYDKTFNNSVGNSDFYLMRLAEVYLIAAEASAHLEDFGGAVGYVNPVLKRARMVRNSDGTISESEYPKDWDAASFADKDLLVAAIFWERCFEMPFEHHEYFDTHRFGAQWLIDNIAKPKNEFLYLPEQEDYYNDEGLKVNGYRSVYYGSDFKYKTTLEQVRRGLISSYPYDELVYNTELDESLQDPLKGQNPSEVCWEYHEK